MAFFLRLSRVFFSCLFVPRPFFESTFTVRFWSSFVPFLAGFSFLPGFSCRFAFCHIFCRIFFVPFPFFWGGGMFRSSLSAPFHAFSACFFVFFAPCLICVCTFSLYFFFVLFLHAVSHFCVLFRTSRTLFCTISILWGTLCFFVPFSHASTFCCSFFTPPFFVFVFRPWFVVFAVFVFFVTCFLLSLLFCFEEVCQQSQNCPPLPPLFKVSAPRLQRFTSSRLLRALTLS